MANGKKTDQNRIDAAERRQRALELRKAGASYRTIGAQLNISEKTAHQDVQRALGHLAELELASADELRTMELLRLDKLMLEAARILAATHPLISGGKVLTGFTESGKPIGLTDDGPKLAAIDRLLRISESRRKLLGLDMQPGATLPTDLEIILRWHDDNRRIIDVTPPAVGNHAAPTPQIAESDSAAPGAVQMRVRWSEMGQESARGDAEPENSA
jgi:hypothetical protein